MINGNLDLYWRASIPHSGIFAMRPNQVRPSFPVFGSHKVSGRGWRFSSNDARVGIHAWVIVYLGIRWIEARHQVISSDATRSENRTRSFGRWVDLPGRITFQAEAGQELGMIVRLYGETWANDEGLAEINIDLSGYTLEELISRRDARIAEILACADILIDGPFVKELSENAGEWRGSASQAITYNPTR
jgi:hypothetical protein